MVSKELSGYHAVSNLLDVEKWWAASSPEIEITYDLQMIGPHLCGIVYASSSNIVRPHSSKQDTLRCIISFGSKDKKRR